jgi:glycosyltransferase 2 family protein
MKFKKKYIFNILVFAVILYFWQRYITLNWSKMQGQTVHLDWLALTEASALTLLGYIILDLLWAPLRQELTGKPMTLANSFRVSAMALMGRYIPGKVWSIAGKAYLSAQIKSEIAVNGVAVTIETVWCQAAGLAFAIMLLPFCTKLDFLPQSARYLSVLLFCLILIISYPSIFVYLVNRLLKYMHQAPLTRKPRFHVLLSIMVGYMLVYFLWAASFAIIVNSMYSIHLQDALVLIIIYPAARVFGVLAFVAPAGLGVQESFLVGALNSIIPGNQLIIITMTVISRLVTTAVELICFLVLSACIIKPRKSAW